MKLKEGYMGFHYIGNILFLKLHGGDKMLMKEGKKKMKGENRKGKQKTPLRLAGYWLPMSRPSEVSKTPSLGSD